MVNFHAISYISAGKTCGRTGDPAGFAKGECLSSRRSNTDHRIRGYNSLETNIFKAFIAKLRIRQASVAKEGGLRWKELFPHIHGKLLFIEILQMCSRTSPRTFLSMRFPQRTLFRRCIYLHRRQPYEV